MRFLKTLALVLLLLSNSCSNKKMPREEIVDVDKRIASQIVSDTNGITTDVLITHKNVEVSNVETVVVEVTDSKRYFDLLARPVALSTAEESVDDYVLKKLFWPKDSNSILFRGPQGLAHLLVLDGALSEGRIWWKKGDIEYTAVIRFTGRVIPPEINQDGKFSDLVSCLIEAAEE